MINIDVKLVRYVLENNGFRKPPNRAADWAFMWHGGSVKQDVYRRLNEY
jgi:hypothetical protein